MEKIKVGIIEDLKNIREPLRDYLNEQDETVCIIEAMSVGDFFGQVNAAGLPDIILCDIGLPVIDGIEGVKIIRTHYQRANIIMLTVFHDSEKIFKAICAGAMGYMLKSSSLEEIKKAVIDIHLGGSYMSPTVARKVLEHFSPPKNDQTTILTGREKQIITSITEGLNNKMIAEKYSISINTVKFHLQNIYEKLHVNSKAALISKTLKKNL